MGSAPQPQSWDRPSRRRTERHDLHVPIDAIVLRSGIPDTLPGRAVNLCEDGVAAVLAGELVPGEAVALQIRLPKAAHPLHARAVVKHCTRLLSGMEFISLPAEQHAMIRSWTGTVASASSVAQQTNISSEPASHKEGDANQPHIPRRRRSRGWILLAICVAVALSASVWWWNWNRGWRVLEAGISDQSAAPIHPQAQVSADVMQKLLRHRVDPEYPAAARSKNLQAVIVLDVVIGRDGSVLEVHARNGPEVLAQAAIEAMRWWRFEPYRIGGQPVTVETTLAMEFNP